LKSVFAPKRKTWPIGSGPLIVCFRNCDRFPYHTAKLLAHHAIEDMECIYPK
jgi:hypothetical protein